MKIVIVALCQAHLIHCFCQGPDAIISTHDPVQNPDQTWISYKLGQAQSRQNMTHQPYSVGQIYCTFSMGESLTVCSDVYISSKWPTNFKYLFRGLCSNVEILHCVL